MLDDEAEGRRRVAFHALMDALPSWSFVKNYVAWAMTATDAPPVFHLGIALSALAPMVPSHVSYLGFGSPLLTPFWTMLIGESGDTRKSSALSLGESIVADAGAHFLLTFPESRAAAIEDLSLLPEP